MSRTNRALDAVYAERERQEKLKAEGAFPFTCADSELDAYRKLAILGEEFGEVAQATMQTDGINTARDKKRDLRKELIQVAAVAVAWAESLEVYEEVTGESIPGEHEDVLDAIRDH